MCPPEHVPFVGRRMLLEYQANYYTAPRMVLVGAGVEHGEFLRLAERYFGDIPTNGSRSSTAGAATTSSDGGQNDLFSFSSSSSSSSSPFIGGQARKPCDLVIKDEFTHVAITFMSNWNERPDDRVPICVLQNLLGGGNSFSAGGPGKGMYSRL
jgi:processing peptidase subunit alpha